jgi:DNA-binding transcriptional LysR family regulator
VINFEDLATFIAVVDAGGFTRAARRLGVSKSIVSRRVARLEGDLGARLVHRTARGFNLTEAGREYSSRARTVLRELAAAKDSISSAKGMVTGKLRLALPVSFGIRHMGPVIAELNQLHPKLELDIGYSEFTVDLVNGNYDAAIRIGRLDASSLIARKVTWMDLWVLASSDYLTKHGTPKRPEDLAQHECIVYTGSRRQQTWRFKQGRKIVVIAPATRLFMDNGEAMIQAAEAGLGITMLPDFIASDSIKAGRLVRLFETYTLLDGDIYVVRPAETQISPKVKLFTETMMRHFGKRRPY